MKAQQTQSYDIPLHDIKTIVEVQEYSLYYLIAVSIVGILIVSLVVYFLYMWYKKKNAFNLRVRHLNLLQELNLNDTKNSAYSITTYGETFKNDSPRHEEMYRNITTRLENYKYRKNVDKFDKETLDYIEVYKGILDV